MPDAGGYEQNENASVHDAGVGARGPGVRHT
jgi:hypothetical protein